MKLEKQRLDMLLVETGLFPTRERARGAVMAGLVYVEGQKVDKPGTRFLPTVSLHVQGEDIPYVSRGGLKLKQAIDEFGFDPSGKVLADVGASTGGFTDCALQHGAAKVYAIDVGHAQLAWSLRQDPRVVVMERTNIRYVEPTNLAEPVDAVTIDVSFISLALVLPAVVRLLQPKGEVVALIKPQFEAGREQVGKRGVVRDPEVHQEVITRVLEIASQLGLGVLGVTFSPVTGPSGNIEFLAYWQLGADGAEQDIGGIVRAAHQQLA